MKLMPLQPISHSQIYVGGDVSIHPTAAIAPGVLLQAESGGRIIIAAGVCLGMGTVLHAVQGTLEIGESANLGTGVLVVGCGVIGHHACIGPSTTLFNVHVQPRQVVPPGSLLGDPSQCHEEVHSQTGDISQGQEALENSRVSSRGQGKASTVDSSQPVAIEKTVSEVYGRTYVDELLVKLMPHKQGMHQQAQDNL